jgi:hypothetical protein
MGSRPGRRLKVSDHRDKISSPLKFLGELSTSVVAETVEETRPAWKELTWSLKRPLRVTGGKTLREDLFSGPCQDN